MHAPHPAAKRATWLNSCKTVEPSSPATAILHRLQILKDNMVRLGTSIVRLIRHDWTRDRLPKEIASIEPFDRVLVDAPCTNTGVIRRRVDVRWRLRPEDFNRMPNEQFSITRAASPVAEAGWRFRLQHMQP